MHKNTFVYSLYIYILLVQICLCANFCHLAILYLCYVNLFLYIRALIFIVTFDFKAWKKLMFLEYQERTLYKTLDDLKKFSPWHQPIFWKPLKAKSMGFKNCNLRVLSSVFFTCCKLSHRYTVNNLKKVLMWNFLNLCNFCHFF